MSTTRTSIAAGLVTSFIVTTSFIPGKVHAQDGFSSPRNADVSAAGARTVEIQAHAGSLRVEGRAGLTQVRVRGTARASSRGMLDDIRLIAERRGDVVFIKADIPEDRGSNFWGSVNHYRGLDLVIEVPATIALDVGDGSGEALFVNVGALSLSDGSGEIEIRGAKGNVRVNDGSGSIEVDGVEGNLRIDDGSGEISVRNVTGDVTVDTDGSGNIVVSGVGGTMRVGDDGSGNIDVDRVAGDFVVGNDGSGTIRYETVKGSVDVPERKRSRRMR